MFSPHLEHSLGFQKATVLAEMLAAKSYMNISFLTIENRNGTTSWDSRPNFSSAILFTSSCLFSMNVWVAEINFIKQAEKQNFVGRIINEFW